MNAISGTSSMIGARMPKLALLLGGKATRLYPLTNCCPKALLPLAGQPFLAHQLKWLATQGVQHIVLCCGHLAEPIRNFAGDGSRFGVKLDYSEDGEALLGTAGAIEKALPLLGETFAVLYGDTLLAEPLAPVWQSFRVRKLIALMTALENHQAWDQSNTAIETGWVKQYKKGTVEAGFTHIDYGFSIFEARCFAASCARVRRASNAQLDPQLDLGQVFRDLIARSELAAYSVQERFYEIGSLAGLRETEEALKRGLFAARREGVSA